MNASYTTSKSDLAAHEVSTVVEAGFGGLENGESLRAASGKFDVLITVDRNLPYQQNIRSLQIAVLIMVSRGITYADLKPLVPELLVSLNKIKAGEFLRIEKI